MKTLHKTLSGAVLPVVIILSTAIIIVGLFALEVLSNSNATLFTSYYNQLAKEAAQAGLIQGSSCLSNAQPDWGYYGLTPDPNNPCTQGSSTATLFISGPIASTFTVTNESDSFGHPIVHSTGTVSIYANSAHTGAPIKTFTSQLNSLLNQTEIRGTVDTSPSKAVQKVASGGAHSCALSSGIVYCWGKNEEGQLGRGYFQNHPEIRANGLPTAVEGLDGKIATDMQVGADHSCAIVQPNVSSSTNDVYCWGKNDAGQLGDGTTTNRASPTKVLGLAGKRITTISTGTNRTSPTCAITDETGSAPNIYCWGGGQYGQTGIGSSPFAVTKATQVYDPYGVFSTIKVQGVALTNTTTCAVRTDGRVYCWGYNEPQEASPACNWGLGMYGEGSQSCTVRTYPVSSGYITQSYFGSKPVDKIAGGGATFCAIASNTAYCWGGNGSQVLGNGVNANTTVPKAVATGTNGLPTNQAVTDIDIDSTTACAVTGGDIYCWGNNPNGQTGIGSNDPNPVPRPRKVQSAPGDSYATATATNVATGFLHTCAVASGSVYCWGYNSWRELLGDDTIDNSYYPHKVANEALKSLYPVQSIAAGVDHTCSVINNSVFCWGGNTYGQLGNGSHTNIKIPNQIPSLSTKNATMVASGDSFSCAVLRDTSSNDSVWCWGRGDSGQLGNNTTTLSQSDPVKVQGLPSSATISSLSAGLNSICAVANQNVYCWGDNNYRQTYYSTTKTYKTATKISNTKLNNTTTKISVGAYSSCAIADQSLYCWGSNIQGVLGTGSTSDSYSTVTTISGGALSGQGVKDISVSRNPSSPSDTGNTGFNGGPFACASLVSSGNVVCWGNNYYNQLATGGSANYTRTPTASTTGDLNNQVITNISTGGNHTCALAQSISILCWGSTADGVIGNDTNGTPLTVTPLRMSDYGELNGHYITAVSAGINHTCAVADSAIYCWGLNTSGQLGANDTALHPVPQIVAAYSTINSTSIMTGIAY